MTVNLCGTMVAARLRKSPQLDRKRGHRQIISSTAHALIFKIKHLSTSLAFPENGKLITSTSIPVLTATKDPLKEVLV